MFNNKIILVTPWFGHFAGGAERLARETAREFNKRGIPTMVFTTCSLSPYDGWWKDHYAPGLYEVEGIEIRRFATGKARSRYDAVIGKLNRGTKLSAREEQDFFDYGINSSDLVDALEDYVDGDYEIVALPYFHGLIHSTINRYPGKVSLTPCFHDEPQFYWNAIETLLHNAKHIFFNSPEEKQMTIKHYGQRVGRRIVESVVTGVGLELPVCDDETRALLERLPESYFVYAGRKEVGKNVPLLCQWFQNYVEEFHSATKLVFIGGGDRALVPLSDCFIDFGFVSEAMKQHLIGGSQGVINLSDNESFSIVIMEGWLLGVPTVVSANCAVTKNHVQRSNGGLYVANSDEFALALKYLEDNDPIRDKLAANGKEYCARSFSFDVVLARYLDEFRQEPASGQVSTAF